MRLSVLILIFVPLICLKVYGQEVAPTKLRVNGVELSYIEKGDGEPLILLHGGQGDYRSWGPQVEVLSKNYRVIAYSRRYNFPNQNPDDSKYRSAYTEADDLAAFVRLLKLKKVILVGTSIGAFTALVFSVKHPALVSSLVLAEPPIHGWARDERSGKVLYNNFINDIWRPAGAAFRSADDRLAMKILIDGFGGAGTFDAMPAKGLEAAIQNARFFRVATSLADPFPNVSKSSVRKLKMPVLIITGENTLEIHKFVNNELARVLPHAARVTIPNAGHGSARQNPDAFNNAITKFLLDNTRQTAF